MVEYDVESLTEREVARIIKSAVTPRPIAWISTVGEDGVDNLAPFSSYNYVSSSQPVVTFHSPNEASGGLKDTARNAVDTGEFVSLLADDYDDVEVLAQRTDPDDADARRDDALDRLTDRQREAVLAAYHAGFFEWPRESAGEEVAADMGVSQPTFVEHLRRAESKLLDALLDDR